MPANDPISLPLGTQRSIPWVYRSSPAVAGSVGPPIDITGAQLTFSVKKNASDSTFVFQKKNLAAGGADAQFTTTDGPNGKASIVLAAADTAALTPGPYSYDIKVVMPDGTIDFPSIGVLMLGDHPSR